VKFLLPRLQCSNERLATQRLAMQHYSW